MSTSRADPKSTPWAGRVLLVFPALFLGCSGKSTEEDACPGGQTRGEWYTDADGDGYGGEVTGACGPAAGLVVDGGDCDDSAAGSNPGEREVWYDGADEDCSGGSDFDQDGDGYERDTDCDDEDAASATCTLYYADGDGDGWGAAEVCLCAPDGAWPLTQGGDCDDTNATTWPGAPELCDGLSNGCDEGWTVADEAELATWLGSAGPVDLTAQLRTGASADFPLPSEGTVNLCAGVWHVRFHSPTGNADVALAGPQGAASTIVKPVEGRVLDLDGAGVKVVVAGLTFQGGSGVDLGGAIASTDASLTITSCAFVANEANRQGGAIYQYGGSLSVRDSTFQENHARESGGAVAALDASVAVSTSVFDRNSLAGAEGAVAYGGGLYAYLEKASGDISVTDSTFTGNTIDTDVGTFSAGGGLFVVDLQPGEIALRGLTLEDQVSSSSLVATSAGLYVYTAGQATVAASDLTLRRNRAESPSYSYGAGLLLSSTSSGEVVLETALIEDNVAVSDEVALGAGAMFSLSGDGAATFDALTVLGNVNESHDEAGSGSTGAGVHLTAVSTVATFTALDVEGNVGENAAGMYADVEDGTLGIEQGSVISNNDGDGLGLFAAGTEGLFELSDVVIEANNGDGIELDAAGSSQASLQLTGSTRSVQGCHANAGYGIDSACEITGGDCVIDATAWDLGDARTADDNDDGDVHYLQVTYDYDDDASFMCDGVLCR